MLVSGSRDSGQGACGTRYLGTERQGWVRVSEVWGLGSLLCLQDPTSLLEGGTRETDCRKESGDTEGQPRAGTAGAVAQTALQRL